ncbi:MAG: DUF4743 domain-containing protein [Casimicrobiaceae bacterium]
MTPASDAVERLIASACRDDIPGFVPFAIAGQRVGSVRPAFAGHLREWPAVFALDDRTGAVSIRDELDDEPHRSAAVASIARELARRGIVTGWRDELYPVHVDGDVSTPVLLHVERAAARALGITSHAVHVNGIAGQSNPGVEPRFWIARRSLTKQIDPGMLDNLVGGGVAAGLGIAATLTKEAWEEAGLDAGLVATARPGRRLRIRREVSEGLQSEIIYVHDLVVPQGITPRNQDGEVAGFAQMSLAAVLAILRAGAKMTADASLVMLDCLDRRGFMKLPESAQARAIFGSLS